MTKQTEIKYKKPTFHLVGSLGEKIDYDEVKSLLTYFQDKGYKIIFIKQEKGWVIEIKKK